MRKYISDLKKGDALTHVFRVSNFSLKEARNGKVYADMTLSDRKGSVPCKAWDLETCLNQDTYIHGGLAVADLRMDEYNGSPQGKIVRMRMVMPSDVFALGDIIPEAPEKAEDMLAEMREMADGFQSEKLRVIVTAFLTQYRQKLLVTPGGKSMHHDVVGGLAYHMLRMARAALSLGEVWPEINSDLLCAGAILHDIGKIEEFQCNPSYFLVEDYSPAGQLLSHNVLGVVMLRELCQSLKIGTDDSVYLSLAHMIESHHGRPEWGSAVVPRFLEADMLHHLDMMDSRVWMYANEQAKAEPGQFTPQRVMALGGNVYRPDVD